MENLPQFLTEKQTAKLTGRALSTLRNERSKGVGLPYYKVGRSVRYSENDIVEWMETKKIVPRQQ